MFQRNRRSGTQGNTLSNKISLRKRMPEDRVAKGTGQKSRQGNGGDTRGKLGKKHKVKLPVERQKDKSSVSGRLRSRRNVAKNMPQGRERTMDSVQRLCRPSKVQRREKEKVKVSYKRQTGLFNPATEADATITIAGLGNIGSQTAMALSRLGFTSFNLYDYDTIEEHNLSSQYFSVADVGKLKTEAIVKHMRAVNPAVLPLACPTKYDPKQTTSGILICAVDTMKARKEFCKTLLKQKDRPELIIDGRMGGGQIEIYTLTTPEEWEKTFTDKPSNDPCSARYICYVSMIISSLIANQVKRYVKKEEYKKNILFHIDTLQLVTR